MSDPVIRNPHTAPADTPPTLVGFILARLDEDERYARYVLVDLGDGDPPVADSWHEGASGILDVGCDQFPLGDSRLSRFIARHDPARVLAEVAAKRRIVEHEDLYGEDDVVLRLLAMPYADHKSYRQEWKP